MVFETDLPIYGILCGSRVFDSSCVPCIAEDYRKYSLESLILKEMLDLPDVEELWLSL
jgi:hypothetical protein